jgi:hypothetical protein
VAILPYSYGIVKPIFATGVDLPPESSTSLSWSSLRPRWASCAASEGEAEGTSGAAQTGGVLEAAMRGVEVGELADGGEGYFQSHAFVIS